MVIFIILSGDHELDGKELVMPVKGGQCGTMVVSWRETEGHWRGGTRTLARAWTWDPNRHKTLDNCLGLVYIYPMFWVCLGLVFPISMHVPMYVFHHVSVSPFPFNLPPSFRIAHLWQALPVPCHQLRGPLIKLSISPLLLYLSYVHVVIMVLVQKGQVNSELANVAESCAQLAP